MLHLTDHPIYLGLYPGMQTQPSNGLIKGTWSPLHVGLNQYKTANAIMSATITLVHALTFIGATPVQRKFFSTQSSPNAPTSIQLTCEASSSLITAPSLLRWSFSWPGHDAR
jgi:hypothetical protein